MLRFLWLRNDHTIYQNYSIQPRKGKHYMEVSHKWDTPGATWCQLIKGGITEDFSLRTQKGLSSQQQSTCCALQSTPSWSTCAGVWSSTGASILTRACAHSCIGKHKVSHYKGITGTVKAYRVKRSRAYYSCWIILGVVSGDVHVLFSQKCFWLWAHTIDSNKQNHSESLLPS